VTRKAAGLTQVELARRARLSSPSRYNFFEAGYGKLTVEELGRVIKVLKRAQTKLLVPISSLSCAVPPPDARKAYRVGAGLTQQELGLRVDVPQSLISDFERGKAHLTPEQGRRWCAAIESATDEAQAVSLTEEFQCCGSVVSHRHVRAASSSSPISRSDVSSR
jgi:transcriptional regulator with XRE-family HTH domain